MTSKQKIVEYKLYKERWIILALFIAYAFNGAVQWIQFSIIANLVVEYYQVSHTQVEWTTTIFMLAYVLLIIPSLFVLDYLGVRKTLILGATGITIGAWIKVFSVARDRFILVQIGQIFQAAFQILTFGLAARFTALWFGVNEISTAGALAILGDQLGTAMAFFIPPMFVKGESLETIEQGLQSMHWTVASTSTIILILIVLCFKTQPKLPPSAAQAKQLEEKKENLLKTLRAILRNRSFLLITLSYGLCCSSINAVSTLFNQIISINFPDETESAGDIGCIIMMSGLFSSLIIGYILDKTRLFKENAVILSMCSAVSMAAFTWALKSNSMCYVIITSIVLGAFTCGYYGTGFQMGIEVTYPISEGISSAIMFLSVQLQGCIITILYGYAIKWYGDLVSNIGITVLFVLSSVVSLLIPPNLKRQNVENDVVQKAETTEFL